MIAMTMIDDDRGDDEAGDPLSAGNVYSELNAS